MRSTIKGTDTVEKVATFYSAKHKSFDGHGLPPDVALDPNLSEEDILQRVLQTFPVAK